MPRCSKRSSARHACKSSAACAGSPEPPLATPRSHASPAPAASSHDLTARLMRGHRRCMHCERGRGRNTQITDTQRDSREGTSRRGGRLARLYTENDTRMWVFRTCRHARSAPIRRGICCAAPAGSPASQKRRRASCSSSRSPGRPARMPFTADSHSPAISANPAARSSAWNTESRGNRRRRHLQHPRRPRTLFSRPRRGDACMLSSCARVAHCMASPGVNGRARAASSARNQPTASLTGSGTVHAAAAPFECGGRLNSAPTHRLDSAQHAAQGGRSAPTTCVGTLPWPKRCRPK